MSNKLDHMFLLNGSIAILCSLSNVFNRLSDMRVDL